MDVFKLAFETTIVGVLAFLWIGVAIDLVSLNFLPRAKSLLVEVNQSLIGAVFLAAAYCLGSAILPISAQLVNDEHWPLPEDSVRCLVVVEEGKRLSLVSSSLPYANVCATSYWTQPRVGDYIANQKNSEGASFAALAVERRAPEANSKQQTKTEERKLLTQFELQETQILGQGTSKEEMFRQLRERTIVLRGAVFNGFVLFLICLFGYIAPEQGRRSRWRTFVGLMLAVSFAIFVLRNGYQDLNPPNIFDIAVLEGVLGAISLFGAFLAINGVRRHPFLRLRCLAVIALGGALAYGGWVWSEVLYDQQVVTFVAVENRQPASASANPEIVHQATEIP